MHLLITLFTVFSYWKWGDRKHWKRYHASMLYITSSGLLYEYFTRDHKLRRFHSDIFFNQDFAVVVYAVLTMPLSVNIFLYHFPKININKIFYIALWINMGWLN